MFFLKINHECRLILHSSPKKFLKSKNFLNNLCCGSFSKIDHISWMFLTYCVFQPVEFMSASLDDVQRVHVPSGKLGRSSPSGARLCTCQRSSCTPIAALCSRCLTCEHTLLRVLRVGRKLSHNSMVLLSVSRAWITTSHNDALPESGVSVPGSPAGRDVCPGLMLADDITLLSSSVARELAIWFAGRTGG